MKEVSVEKLSEIMCKEHHTMYEYICKNCKQKLCSFCYTRHSMFHMIEHYDFTAPSADKTKKIHTAEGYKQFINLLENEPFHFYFNTMIQNMHIIFVNRLESYHLNNVKYVSDDEINGFTNIGAKFYVIKQEGKYILTEIDLSNLSTNKLHTFKNTLNKPIMLYPVVKKYIYQINRDTIWKFDIIKNKQYMILKTTKEINSAKPLIFQDRFIYAIHLKPQLNGTSTFYLQKFDLLDEENGWNNVNELFVMNFNNTMPFLGNFFQQKDNLYCTLVQGSNISILSVRRPNDCKEYYIYPNKRYQKSINSSTIEETEYINLPLVISPIYSHGKFWLLDTFFKTPFSYSYKSRKFSQPFSSISSFQHYQISRIKTSKIKKSS